MPTQQEQIPELKAKFLEYYADLPIQKLAAGWIRRDEDTIARWKKDDAEFAGAITEARSAWARSKVHRVRSTEWLLERIAKDEFAERTEITGKEGKDLPAPILGGASVHPNNRDK